MDLTIVNDVLYGHDADIVEMVRQRIPLCEGFTEYAVGLGVVKRNKLIGGVVFDQYSATGEQSNISVSIAFDSPAWATPKTLRQLFRYPFTQLGCRRITALVADDNDASRSAVVRLGFQHEGVLRKFYPGDMDAHIYGLLREECRWIEVNHEVHS